MFKWIAFGLIAFVLLASQVGKVYLTHVIAATDHDNATYLVSEYKTRPGNAAARIRFATARCVTERVGQNIPALNKLFGEVVLYIVSNVGKDEKVAYQGLLGVLGKQEAAMNSLAREAAPAREKAIRAMFVEFQQEPLTLVRCVADKMRTPVSV